MLGSGSAYGNVSSAVGVALLQLDDRRLSIGEIATRLGYTELPNFTRAFRKWTGVTPAAYRSSK